ncbi:putative ABC transporter, substrate-binding protein [Desulfonema limicola]|uniref:ABC transporter, substrate-binding protein n=1 Tax=Desulfonema limicola TaxID=45656 RepID=A0A975B4F6_9BACT|nr:ABC transporter substrate binding protein [Desulfonema limicola]QTA78592.1 putative ABC transporter, substrate-binding protein [Desulfonema limicola]
MKQLFKVLACTLFVSLFCAPAMGAGKILLVQSYYSDYSWVNSITDGVKKGLEGSGAQLEIFYMDTKRNTSAEWKIESGELAKKKVAEFKPDIIIPADDNAQQFFAKDYVGKQGINIVFTGVNADPGKYGYPASNATGVIQKPLFVPSIEMLLKIKPDIKKIALISDDGPTSDAMISYMKTLKAPVEVVSYDQPSTFDQWKSLIEQYQKTVDAIAVNLYQTIKESAGNKSLPQKTVMEWTMANNKLPIMGLYEDAFDDGALCGIAESGEEQGLQAASLAVQILNGKKPGDLKIVIPTKGLVVVNLKTAEKLGLTIPFEILESAGRIIEF